MTHAAHAARTDEGAPRTGLDAVAGWLRAAEERLDAMGRPAWIAAMVAAFVLAWPVGLALLFYMIWSGRMGRKNCRNRSWNRRAACAEGTGNAAFDAYREATLRRLEEEQAAFEEFLARLRRAKDQAEFDQFMAERRAAAASTPAAPAPDPRA
ncbi:DUF2852 domain-containing protein [Oceanicella actignis]|uniref:DUF2852 domain-containing protein n=1 Tax=Oceanicella actignis TaxID=1189325 RepID=UPI0011E7130C|nr:uncharacterized protein DUF2852 [Oceanicella actignis]